MKKSNSRRFLTIICLLMAFMGVFLLNSTEAKAASLSNPRVSDGVSTWDCVWFGNYYQSDTTGKTKDPIKWRVLSVNGNDAFLVADQNLDAKRYNETYTSVTWETCTLRKWLNGDFINTAFTVAEQNAIFSTKVVNENNPSYGTAGGNDTQDKVYLLSLGEVKNTAYGFPSNTSDTRVSTNTPYVASKYNMSSSGVGDWWWLRSPGDYSYYAANVSNTGSVCYNGRHVHSNRYAVRPALHLNLSSSHLWSYAGTVSSDGSENETEPNPGENPGGNPSEPGDNPGQSESEIEKKYKANITAALPDMSSLGGDKIKGPEISIAGNKGNLFSVDTKLSLPMFDSSNLKLNVNTEDQTVEVLMGIEDKHSADTSTDDAYWSDTYKEVKSLVQACGGTVDNTALWNKFSKLRGKLKKINANAVFNVDGNATGYMKLQMKDDGTIGKVLEGGVTAGFEAGGKVKTPIWWIIYSELGLGGSVDGKIQLTAQDTKAISASGELGLAVKPSVALGADAVIVDIKGGLEGTLGGKAQFPWKSFKESVEAYLTGKLFAQVTTIIPHISGDWSYDFPKLELYPNLGTVTKKSGTLQYQEPKAITKKQVRSMAKAAKQAVDSTEDSLVYENAKPKLTKLSDGRMLMVYLDDTEDTASKQTKLMYRVYDNGTWSDAKQVNQNGNLDTAGELCMFDGTAYVIYMSSDKEITEDMKNEEIAKSMNLYVSKFDGTGFSTPSVIENNGKWKYSYHLAKRGDALCAVWAENSANDMLLENGSTTINESQLTDGTWKEAKETAKDDAALQEISAGTLGNKNVTAYVKDDKAYIDGNPLDISSYGEKADSLKFLGDKIYFRIDGVLYTYDGNEISSLNVKCTPSYEICDDKIYWIEQDNFKSEIYAQSMDSQSDPVALTEEGGYIGGFSVKKNAEDKPVLAYTYQQVNESTDGGNPYGKTMLKYTDTLSRNQAEVTNIAYDVLSFTPGEDNEVAVTIGNTGTDTLHHVNVTISCKGQELYQGKAAETLASGESVEKRFPVPIPEGFNSEDITVKVTADESFAKDTAAQKKTKLEECSADLEILAEGNSQLTVTNKADEPAKDVTLAICNQKENGTKIRTVSLGDLKAKESKKISIQQSDWDHATKDAVLNKKYLYCEVKQSGEEYELWNNNVILSKDDDFKPSTGGGTEGDTQPTTPSNPFLPAQPTVKKVSKITITGSSKKIAYGKKVSLKAKISPSNASNQSVTWKSSNKKYAAVSSKGVVTTKKAGKGKTVTITAVAKDGSGKKATYKIQIMKGVVKKISISGKKSVKAGKSFKLKVKVTASKGANKKVKWTCSNSKYATVSTSGKVTVKKAGKGKKVKITVTATDGSGKKKTVTIKIK